MFRWVHCISLEFFLSEFQRNTTFQLLTSNEIRCTPNNIRVTDIEENSNVKITAVEHKIQKLGDQDDLVHIQLEAVTTKLVGVERSNDNQEEDITVLEKGVEDLESKWISKLQKFVEIESKVTQNQRKLEKLKKETNATLQSVQDSLDEVTDQVGDIRKDSNEDVDALVDGFDFLIESLGANLDRRKRRSTGPSKLVSKIQQLAEAFRNMRHKFSENNAEFDKVYAHFQQINDKFIENESTVKHIKAQFISYSRVLSDVLINDSNLQNCLLKIYRLKKGNETA